jgi:hypothetical protein
LLCPLTNKKISRHIHTGREKKEVRGRLLFISHYIPGTQDEAARLMDDILTPIPIDLKSLNPKS